MKRRIRLRIFLYLLLVVSLALPLFAAGEKEGKEEKREIDRDHTLIWAVAATPGGFDINYYLSFEAMEADRNMYDSLLRYPMVKDNDSGFLVPDFTRFEGQLAEDWWVSDDGLTITIKLKEGILSHHGNELTAQNIVWRFEREMGMDAIGKYFLLKGGLKISDVEKQVKIIDKYTFSFTMPEVNPIVEAFLTHMFSQTHDLEEIRKHYTEDDPWGSDWLTLNSAGFGPYKLVEFVPAQHAILEAVEPYWDEDYPMYFKRVIIKEIPQSSNRMALLLNGDVDVAKDLTWKELTELEGKPGIKLWHYPSNIVTRVEFNFLQPPFDNPLVRKALSFATPYQEIIDNVYLGLAGQAKSPLPSTYPSFTGDFWKYELDYDKAKELLAEAGYPNGFKTVLEIETGLAHFEQIAIILKDSYKKIGVDVEIEKLLTGDFYTKAATHGYKAMYLYRDMPGVVDGSFPWVLWIGETSVNDMGYRNEEMQNLFVEANKSLDQPMREKAFRRMQEIVVWEDPWAIYLVEPGFHLAVLDDIDGLAWQTLQEIRWGLAYRNK